MQNLDYLFAAYTVVWLLIFGYMWSVSKRQKNVENELKMLKDLQQENTESA